MDQNRPAPLGLYWAAPWTALRRLQGQPAPAARLSARYVCHFDASDMLVIVGLDQKDVWTFP